MAELQRRRGGGAGPGCELRRRSGGAGLPVVRRAVGPRVPVGPGAGAPAARGGGASPSGGGRSVRASLSARGGARRPTLFSYVWCRACRRFVGTRAAPPPGLVFSAPLSTLSPADRRELERSLIGF